MKLVTKRADQVSQKTYASQFFDPSQQIMSTRKIFENMQVYVDFKGEDNQNESVDNNRGLQHLSGGQKTVVVVALIFAVLKIEAAPFYILDEFDHALDSQYRQAIASLINELSLKSQFFITTFKPEIIQESNANIFEVSFDRKKSSIKVIDKEKALGFVKNKVSEKEGEDSQSSMNFVI